MKKKRNRLISALMTGTMILGMMVTPVYADIPETDIVEEQTQVEKEEESVGSETDFHEETDTERENEEMAKPSDFETESFIAEETEMVETEIIKTETSHTSEASEIYINPLYKDIITEEQVQESLSNENPDEESAISCFSDDSAISYLTSIDEAVHIMRDSLKNKAEVVDINLKLDSNVDAQGQSKVWNSIFDKAIEHTGKPNEGDFLMTNWFFCSGLISQNPDEDKGRYQFHYKIAYITTKEQDTAVAEKADEIFTQLDFDKKSNYEKIEAIYEYICENVDYDEEHVNDDAYHLKASAYAALIDKKAVCQGYATLFYYMALKSGIDCRIITSYSLNHSWNIVELDDLYYLLDTTWDAQYHEKFGEYKYFLKGSVDFEDHKNEDDNFSDEIFARKYVLNGKSYQKDNVHSHEFVETVIVNNCTQKGYHLHTCADCGFSYKDQYVEALGHDYVKDTENTSVYICSRCHKVSKFPSASHIRVVFDKTGPLKDVNGSVKNNILLTDGVIIIDRSGYGIPQYGVASSTDENGLTDVQSVAGTISYGDDCDDIDFCIRPIRNNPVLLDAMNTEQGVSLSWEAETGAFGYKIYRQDSNNDFSLIKTIEDSAITSWTDANIDQSQCCTYYICAYTYDREMNILESDRSNMMDAHNPYPEYDIKDFKVLWCAFDKVYEKDSIREEKCLENIILTNGEVVLDSFYFTGIKMGYSDESKTIDGKEYVRITYLAGTLVGRHGLKGELDFNLQAEDQSFVLYNYSSTELVTKLHWPEQKGVLGYEIYRKGDSTNFELVKKLDDPTQCSWNDEKVEIEKSYSYYVRSYTLNKDGIVIYSDPSNVITYCPPKHEHLVICEYKKATLNSDGYNKVTCCICNEKVVNEIFYYPKTIKLATDTVLYTGKAQKPKVSVIGSNGKAISNSNYNVSYTNNINVGAATVTVTFKGEYEGTKKLNFKITKKENVITASNYTKSYSSGTQKFTIKTSVYDRATLSFSSNNRSIVVDKHGKVTIAKKFIGKATITIKASATKNYNASTKYITVYVNPKGTSLSSVKYSSAGKLTIKWKKNSAVTGYQIQYCTNSKFNSGIVTKTVKSARVSSLNVSKLKKGTKYYIRIRAYKTVAGKSYYSGWSGVKNVTVKK